MLSYSRLLPGLFSCLLIGCSAQPQSEKISPARYNLTLDQLPDCENATVSANHEAQPAAEDGFYVVTDCGHTVCATDFDGLQALAQRLASSTGGVSPLDARPAAAADPMPGLNDDEASADPMPGRGGYASADPMPGRGGYASADPMPGRGGESYANAESKRSDQGAMGSISKPSK